jgi:hypothetical protein
VVLWQAFGGLVVGLVTKYAGSVVKGFSLIAGRCGGCIDCILTYIHMYTHTCYCVGILITGLAQYLIDGKPLGVKDGYALFDEVRALVLSRF